jgi:hypothetical protein
MNEALASGEARLSRQRERGLCCRRRLRLPELLLRRIRKILKFRDIDVRQAMEEAFELWLEENE